MYYISLFILGLLPELLSADVLGARAKRCGQYAAVYKGDTCNALSKRWNIDVSTFQSLNTNVKCPNLESSRSYCVADRYTTDIPAASTSTAALATKPGAHSPTRPGTVQNGDKFYKVVAGDHCLTIDSKNGISAEQFKKWNHFIDADCTNLLLGYYICVHAPDDHELELRSAGTDDPFGIGDPGPKMPGVVSNCKKFHLVRSGETCSGISKGEGITLNKFRSWNKKLNSQCDNLWLGYYVCIGV